MLGKGRMAGAVGGDDRNLKAWIISSVMCFIGVHGGQHLEQSDGVRTRAKWLRTKKKKAAERRNVPVQVRVLLIGYAYYLRARSMHTTLARVLFIATRYELVLYAYYELVLVSSSS